MYFIFRIGPGVGVGTAAPRLRTHDLTLVRAGGGDAPPMSFLEWPPNGWADRAEILDSLWSILCATFGKKKMTGSGQVTEL